MHQVTQLYVIALWTSDTGSRFVPNSAYLYWHLISQTYWVVSSFWVACTPEYATKWKEPNTIHLNLLGTYSHSTPVDTSQTIVVLVAGIGMICSLRDKVLLSRISCSWAKSVKSMIRHWSVCMALVSIHDSVSTTQLSVPLMWQMSFVNWDMKSKCLSCLQLWVCWDFRAQVRGLWSVSM